jgi:hypothetical protein
MPRAQVKDPRQWARVAAYKLQRVKDRLERMQHSSDITMKEHRRIYLTQIGEASLLSPDADGPDHAVKVDEQEGTLDILKREALVERPLRNAYFVARAIAVYLQGISEMKKSKQFEEEPDGCRRKAKQVAIHR